MITRCGGSDPFLSLIHILSPFVGLKVNALSADSISAPSAVLVESSTGKVLFEKNPHEQRPCASVTKVMTLLLVFEAVDSGKLSLDDEDVYKRQYQCCRCNAYSKVSRKTCGVTLISKQFNK